MALDAQTQNDKNGPGAETGPEAIRLRRRSDGKIMQIRGDGTETAVKVRRPFPWSAPDRFISLADEKDVETALVSDLGALDPESRAILEEDLREIGFMFEVLGVESIESVFEIRNWRIRTEQGVCLFQTKEDQWPLPLKRGGYLIQSLDNNLFHIPDPKTMDAKSRKLLWAYTD
jgi:hypothetical protein